MLHQTALHDYHESVGATLVDFGGWDMPLWYKTGAVKEHLAVIQHAGLFDIGHMDGLLVSGRGALDLLQYAFTKDLSSLKLNRAGYGAFLDENGYVLDDAVIYALSYGRYFVVINCGHAEIIMKQLQSLIEGKKYDAYLQNLAGTYTKLDLQGPASFKVMQSVICNPEMIFEKMPYFSAKGEIHNIYNSEVYFCDGTPIFISRTGYTGEQGFEIFVPYEASERIWRQILEAGEKYGVIPCGLAARDSLRAGAVLPLSGQDLGKWVFAHNPWSFALPLDAEGKWTKDFIGRDALDKVLKENLPPFIYPYCGYDPRKVTSPSHDEHPKVLLDGQEIGDVLTCVADVSIGRVNNVVYSAASPDKPEGFTTKGLVCGFVRVDRPLEIGTALILADARRKINVEIVSDIRPARTARKALGSL